MRRSLRAIGTLLLLVAVWLPCCGGDPGREEPPTLACAASLRRVLPDLLEAYAARAGGGAFTASYAASGTLRRQVEAGAPIAGVILASGEQVDMLVEKHLADREAVRVVARNELVLVAGEPSAGLRFQTLDKLPAEERIAIGAPETVPAGRYARDALRGLGIWTAVEPHCVYTHDVAGVVAYVRRGEVAAGVAYATEVVGLSDVHVVDRATGAWAPRPLVVAAPVRGAPGEGAVEKLLAFLVSAEAAVIWERHGFLRP